VGEGRSGELAEVQARRGELVMRVEGGGDL